MNIKDYLNSLSSTYQRNLMRFGMINFNLLLRYKLVTLQVFDSYMGFLHKHCLDYIDANLKGRLDLELLMG